MNCRRIRRELDGFRENRLAPQCAERVREHLEQCRACRARLAELDYLDQRLRSVIVAPDPAPGFRQRCHRAWENFTPATTVPVRCGRPLPVFAALAAVLLLALGLGRYFLSQTAVPGHDHLPSVPVVTEPPAGSWYDDHDPPSTWQPFVVVGERLAYYNGRTAIRLRNIAPDIVEITVDAFPVQMSDN